jgi:hypothetical protein
MRRRLLPFLALGHAAAAKPRPRCRSLHSASLLDAVAASASPSRNLLSRGSGSLPTTTARAGVPAAPRGAGSLELLSWQQLGRKLGRQIGRWLPSAWTLFKGAAALRSVW